MNALLGMVRRQLTGVIALVLLVTMFFLVRLPETSAAERQEMASGYAFAGRSIALPAAGKQQSVREVNQAYKHIDAWVSSVGAAVAMNDLDGDGLPNDLCLVDPRTDQVVVTPTPGPNDTRYAPIALDPAPLPMTDTMAPMGCVPGDFNEDGRMDLLVYNWGRTPVLYLQKADHGVLAADSFAPVEMVAGVSSGGRYTGPLWNTNAATIGDFDGSGHLSVFIGNYFPDSPMLDPSLDGDVTMNHSMSHATNSGEKHIYRFTGATAGAQPTATFELVPDAIPEDARLGWTLATSATDLDGDLLPEIYIANDFGRDHLLYNTSTPGRIAFASVTSDRTPGTPKSKRIGDDSFKGMGVDFGDTSQTGMFNMFVSNLTTGWGIVESNFHYVNTARDHAEMRAQLSSGTAPFRDVSGADGTAWSGWSWDVKMADFTNRGELDIAVSNGFVKGYTNRWPQLQELAMANDSLVAPPSLWPNTNAGDDLAGNQSMHLFSKGPDGRYVDVAPELGLAVPVPTRGIAVGDADGDGRLDMAIARQFDAPIFYENQAPDSGGYLNLRLLHDVASSPGTAAAPGSPVVGAQVTVTDASGTKYVERVDGSSGHAGRRSNEVHIGLGSAEGPVQVELAWRDRNGDTHQQELRLDQGRHTFVLGDQAKEK